MPVSRPQALTNRPSHCSAQFKARSCTATTSCAEKFVWQGPPEPMRGNAPDRWSPQRGPVTGPVGSPPGLRADGVNSAASMCSPALTLWWCQATPLPPLASLWRPRPCPVPPSRSPVGPPCTTHLRCSSSCGDGRAATGDPRGDGAADGRAANWDMPRTPEEQEAVSPDHVDCGPWGAGECGSDDGPACERRAAEGLWCERRPIPRAMPAEGPRAPSGRRAERESRRGGPPEDRGTPREKALSGTRWTSGEGDGQWDGGAARGGGAGLGVGEPRVGAAQTRGAAQPGASLAQPFAAQKGRRGHLHRRRRGQRA